MGKNVIILGAGFSFNAGIPMMPAFVQTMYDLAMRRSWNGQPISPADCLVFSDAMKVSDALNGYHGQANFDDRNIEDVLSILSFRVLSGAPKAKEQWEVYTKAIARTIEITCTVKHSGPVEEGPDVRWAIEESGHSLYRQLWHSLFRWQEESLYNPLPTLITFNYDLVLERSLLQMLTTKGRPLGKVPYVKINYHYPFAPPQIWKIEDRTYTLGPVTADGTVARKTTLSGADKLQEIDLLKLHGSLNFPSTEMADPRTYNIAAPQDNPYILPPIFNKLSSNTPNQMWKIALEKISEAHNIVIVGYSLPQTDIYMQYFLKSAVGPNVRINKISVYNPTLFNEDDECTAMKGRYASCFSEQLRRRIDFRPRSTVTPSGSTENFVHTLHQSPDSILY